MARATFDISSPQLDRLTRAVESVALEIASLSRRVEELKASVNQFDNLALDLSYGDLSKDPKFFEAGKKDEDGVS